MSPWLRLGVAGGHRVGVEVETYTRSMWVRQLLVSRHRGLTTCSQCRNRSRACSLSSRHQHDPVAPFGEAAGAALVGPALVAHRSQGAAGSPAAMRPPKNRDDHHERSSTLSIQSSVANWRCTIRRTALVGRAQRFRQAGQRESDVLEVVGASPSRVTKTGARPVEERGPQELRTAPGSCGRRRTGRRAPRSGWRRSGRAARRRAAAAASPAPHGDAIRGGWKPS